MDRLRRLEPRARIVALATWVLLWPTWLALGPVEDGDIWWHLRTGEWIAGHRSLPHTDVFSRTGGTWVVYSWLFDLAVHALYAVGGLRGIVAYRAVAATAIAVLLLVNIRSREPRLARALLITLVALELIEPVLSERSWLITILGVLASVAAVTATRRGRHAPLALLPLVYVLWANCHVQFVYGLMILGVAATLDGAYRLALRAWLPTPGRGTAMRPWILLVLCALATLVTPHGLGLYRTIWGYASQGDVSRWIYDLRSPDFHLAGTWLVVIFGLLALLRLGATIVAPRAAESADRDPFFEAALVILGFASFFHYRRDLWLLVAFAALALAGRLPEWPGRWRPGHVLTSVALFWELAAILGIVLAVPLAIASWTELRLTQDVAQWYPAEAVTAVIRRGDRGPLYNHFNWGGYLIWALPQLPVSMDGRSDVHSADLIDRNLSTWEGTETDPLLDGANLVIADRQRFALSRRLQSDPAWEQVHEDRLSEVFVRRTPVGSSTSVPRP